MTEVVAALIIRDRKIFICQRPPHKARPLLWEFVGGKVEKGETREAALIRECREELGVDVAVGEIFTEVTHVYPDITVHLTLFFASFAEEPRCLEHHDIRWVAREELGSYEFCPADIEILEKIKLLDF